MNKFELDKKPKITSGFKTPDGYFEELQAKMLQKIDAEETRVVPIYRKKNSWIYAAAAALVVSLSIPVYNIWRAPKAEIDNATLENYLSNHSGISDADLAELLDEKDIEKISIDSDIEGNAIEDLLSTNANLEEYLIN
jgi:hypothetical protein